MEIKTIVELLTSNSKYYLFIREMCAHYMPFAFRLLTNSLPFSEKKHFMNCIDWTKSFQVASTNTLLFGSRLNRLPELTRAPWHYQGNFLVSGYQWSWKTVGWCCTRVLFCLFPSAIAATLSAYVAVHFLWCWNWYLCSSGPIPARTAVRGAGAQGRHNVCLFRL